MRIKNYLRMLLVVLVTLAGIISPLTTKAQEDSILPDSIMTLVPLDGLKYGNFHADPIAIVGDVIVLKNNFHQFNGITEINDVKITSPIWGFNLKTKEVLINNAITTGNKTQAIAYSKQDSSVFYMMSEDRHDIFKVKVNQNSIDYELQYSNPNSLLNYLSVEDDGTIFFVESWKGIKTMRDKKVIDSLNFELDVYTLARKNDIIYFGGNSGVIGYIIIGTGEIVSLQNNMNWFGGVLVYNINDNIYATGLTNGGRNGSELFKLDFDNQTWKKVTEENVYEIKWDNMYKKYTTSISSIKGDVFFEEDVFIPIQKHPYEFIVTPEKFRNTQYEHYNENIGFGALGSRAIFEFDGKTYGVGWGIIGTYQMVPVVKDTTGNVSTKTLNLKNFSIYPNPAQNIINIPNLVTEVEVSVYDISGHLVLVQKSSGLVDISTLNSGLYFIRINGYKPEKFYKN